MAGPWIASAAVVAIGITPLLFSLPSELVVFAVGAMVGATELFARYRDAPFRPLLTPFGLLYALINGGAAILAFRLLQTFAVDFGATDPERIAFYRMAVASLGAMAFFRTGLFTIRIGDSDIPVGPALVLQIILQALDRSYDRHRATPRSTHVAHVMREVSFVRAYEALPSLCFGLMQNVSTAERSEIGDEVKLLRESDTMSEEAKCIVLGLALMNVVGERVLQSAVEALGTTIKGSSPLDVEIYALMARTPASAIVASLDAACRIVCHPDQADVDADAEVTQIQDLDLTDDAKAVFVVQVMVRRYGSGIVANALAGLVPPVI